jgi:hypothetical protein
MHDKQFVVESIQSIQLEEHSKDEKIINKKIDSIN